MWREERYDRKEGKEEKSGRVKDERRMMVRVGGNRKRKGSGERRCAGHRDFVVSRQ